MHTHSIRWRLTLSYAVIACFAALALGAVLLAILRNYYAGKERDYLQSNANSFTILLASAMAEEIPVDVLRPQLENMAFFSQARIRVLDNDGNLLFDSGEPDEPHVLAFVYSAPDESLAGLRVESMSLVPVTETVTIVGAEAFTVKTDEIHQPFNIQLSTPFRKLPGSMCLTSENIEVSSPEENSGIFMGGASDVVVSTAMSAVPLTSSFYGFEIGSGVVSTWKDVEQDQSYRSNQRVEQAVFDSVGRRVGTIVLSDGPAYGKEIVNSVARGWVLAGGIAVLLAAAVGWVVSRQITKPLVTLTTVTTDMASGNLSARADIIHQDELGVLAQSFNHMADRIQEIVTTLQRFVADAAHELHTPLTALRTNLELVENEHPSPAMRRAHEQVIRLQKLTDDLLALSRIEAQSPTQQAAPVDLLALVQSVGEVYASRAEQADIDYILDLPDTLPPVYGYTDQLQCVLSNLLDNAIKFTPAGGSIKVLVQASDHTVDLSVQDTGIGIPPSDLPRLFERFSRGHNVATYPGSGLGLAIVKAIVKAHGGSVRVENGMPGTRITLTLPVTRP